MRLRQTVLGDSLFLYRRWRSASAEDDLSDEGNRNDIGEGRGGGEEEEDVDAPAPEDCEEGEEHYDINRAIE